MKRLGLYPYMPDAETLLLYKNQMTDFQVTAIGSFEEDHQLMQELNASSNLLFTTDISQFLDRADALFLLENVYIVDSSQNESCNLSCYFDCIEQADKMGKQVLIGKKFWDFLQLDTAKAAHVRPIETTFKEKGRFAQIRRHEIDVPVVAILGLGENCSKFECQLLTRNVFQSAGYRADCLCANPAGQLLGMTPLPSFLYDPKLSFSHKIENFNQYVFEYVREKNPDVLIVDCPGGLLPLGDFVSNYYGELPLVISNALSIDVGLVCVYFSSHWGLANAQSLSEYCKVKFSIPVGGFCLARQATHMDVSAKKIEYLHFNEATIRDQLPAEKHPNMFCPVDTEHAHKVLSSIVTILEENLEAV
jgi:peptide maturation system protein (TIGR04066 family)